MKKKQAIPRPRPVLSWATMDPRTRKLSQVYVGTGKRYVDGDCLFNEITVRVRIVPA